MSTTSSPTADILPFQLPLCPALPQVIGNKDYTDFEILLERIEGLLRSSGVEALFVRLSLEALRAEAREAGVELTDAHIARHREQSRLALRCEVLRELLMRPAYREMSRRLAESALCRRFCGIGEIERVRVPGKSRLQTYSTWLAPEAMRAVLDELLRSAGSEPGAARMGLEARIELNLVLLDSTCLKANIHFPTDWVLLRDAVRTLMKATVVILKNNFLGGQPRARGYERRAAAVDWAVLAHNLRVIARLPQTKAASAPTKDPPPASLAA